MKRRYSPAFVFALLAGAALDAAHAFDTDQLASRDLAELSIEELASLPITSVARRQTPLDASPASVFVITADDIHRSGATTIPEILRLAPNLQVARVNASDYAITARGFNNAVGNKLLVLMDGRVLYTPVFSGVFWEMQDTMVEDIERIEVISGPGATLWGANAVNGVINIITRASGDTQGALATADAGTDERGVALRYGGTAGANGTYRVYARARGWDATRAEAGGSAVDQWDRRQLGFRADWQVDAGAFTVQGDAFDGSTERRGDIAGRGLSGHNLLGRWHRDLDGGGALTVHAFWDRQDRDEVRDFRAKIDTYELDFQHDVPLERHTLTWGGGFRHAQDEVRPGIIVRYVPASRSMDWYHLYFQAEAQLTLRVAATAGLKFESNPFTGIESLPNLRVAWRHSPDALLWAAVSRAVRSPSRFDRNVFLPAEEPFLVIGGPDFMSEVAQVYEVGYRARPSATFSYSVTAYRNSWDDLRSGSPPPFPLTIENHVEGTSYGIEGWVHWQVTPSWRLSGGALWQRKDLALEPGVPADTSGPDASTLHNDPDYQLKLNSRSNLGRNLELDLQLRHVDELPTQPVPSYTELDARLGWRVSSAFELSLVGRNLLQSSHAEFGNPATRSEFERTLLLRAGWRF